MSYIPTPFQLSERKDFCSSSSNTNNLQESAEDAAVRMARKTVACGIVTPSIHDPPVKSDDCLMREVAGGVYKWKCPICDGSYSRSRTIITHFPRCVVKNGNPMGLRWDDTPLLSTVGIRH